MTSYIETNSEKIKLKKRDLKRSLFCLVVLYLTVF